MSVDITILIDDYAGYEVRGLVGEHGLSVLIEVKHDSWTDSILFDVGQTGEAVLHNSSRLGIDISRVSTIALSHRHYDHTGGLLKVLQAIGKRVSVVAHPEIFTPQVYVTEKRVSLDLGPPFTKRDVESAGASPVLVRDMLRIAPGIYFLGEISRSPGFEGEIQGFYSLKNGRLIPDEMLDDTAIAIDLGKKGLVVVTGCSHSGIVNIVKHAIDKIGKPVFSIIGGLHLVNTNVERIEEVINGLVELGVEEVHVGHCTGLEAECRLKSRFRNKFRKIHSGYKVYYKLSSL